MVGPLLLYGKLQYQQWSRLVVIRMNWTQMEKFHFRIIASQLQNLEASSSVYFMIDPKFPFFIFLTNIWYRIAMKEYLKSILEYSNPKIHFTSNNNNLIVGYWLRQEGKDIKMEILKNTSSTTIPLYFLKQLMLYHKAASLCPSLIWQNLIMTTGCSHLNPLDAFHQCTSYYSIC